MAERWEEQVAAWVTEAHELRFEIAPGDQTQTLTEIHSLLLAARGNLDRIEEILVSLVRMNGKAKQAVADHQNALGDAWDQQAGGRNVSFSFSDPAPRERYAQYNQRTIHETVEARQAERVHRQMETSLEAVRIMYRGLDSARRDLETRIRLISLESALGG